MQVYTPYDRHLLLEPSEWLSNIRAQLHQATSERPEHYYFSLSNSFALLLVLAGAPDVARVRLVREIEVAKKTANPSDNGIDAFVNLWRLAHLEGQLEKAQQYIIATFRCIKSQAKIEVDDHWPGCLYEQKYRDMLLRNILCETMKMSRGAVRNELESLIDSESQLFANAGITYLEYRMATKQQTEGCSVFGDQIEIFYRLIAPIYEIEANNNVDEYLGQLLVFVCLLESLGLIDHRFHRILERCSELLIENNREDLAAKCVQILRKAVSRDYVLTLRWESKFGNRLGQDCAREAYQKIRAQLDEVNAELELLETRIG